jgi:hypothetical protein
MLPGTGVGVMSDTTQSSVIPFSEIGNKAFVTPGFGPAERTDPFWSMLWPNSNGGPIINWHSLHSEHAMADAGLHVPIRHGRRRHSQSEAIALLNNRRTRLITLGTVNLWRAITAEQLVAMTGRPGIGSARSEEIGLLFDAGLIQRGRFSYNKRSLSQASEIFRPDTQAYKADLSSLSYRDWLGATLGDEPIRGHQYDRHNILTTELSLRAAETCPLRSVLGEAVAMWPRLFGPELRPNPHRSADAVWIRDDGLKIAVELTATITQATIKKIEQLADLLARDTTKSVVVLFVVAAQPNKGRTGDVTNQLRQAIKKSSHSSRTRILTEVDKRMVLARWEDWFPEPGLLSRDFIPLSAQRYSSVDNEWSFTWLLDPFDTTFAGAYSPESEETSTRLNDVFGTPWWMRTGPSADLDANPLE